MGKITESKICKNCLIDKPLSEYTPVMRNGKHNGWQGKCKPCRSEMMNHIITTKRAEKDPHLYRECDDCMKIWNKARGGDCPDCGSKNTVRFETF